jgi:hypothetical protein
VIGFTAPWALAGLAAAGIPLLLHLFARREPPTVMFPATRYLAETARAHHRRLTLQHWILLLIRTLLIAALAFAAAGPTIPSGGVASHAPMAIALVLDNSASSGATVQGTPVLDELRRAAERILDDAHPDDALWLLTSDGNIAKGTSAELGETIRRLGVTPYRLDLGAAIGSAREALDGQRLPGTIVVLSDLQSSALSAIPGARSSKSSSLVVLRPGAEPVPNLTVSGILPGRQPWGPEGGRLAVAVSGDPNKSAALSVRFGNRPPRQQLARAGATVMVNSGILPPGWWEVRAELEPDELRVDDARVSAVRVTPPARASCRSEDRFLTVACDVLFANGRLVRGNDVSLGWLGPGASVVQPPEDRAGLGGVKRALAARGVSWRFGDAVPGAAPTDSGAVIGRQPVNRRYALEGPPTGRDVLVTVAGTPWLVRSDNVLLVGSRMDPGWTDLPVSADFVPFVDFLANRAVRGELAVLAASPGQAITLPSGSTGLTRNGQSRPVQGSDLFRPTEPGLSYLLSGSDTIGVLAVNLDPRESELARANDGAIRQLWPDARIATISRAREATYAAGGRADLRGWVLGLVALLAIADASFAGWGRKSRSRS